jgi:hypothetical protein
VDESELKRMKVEIKWMKVNESEWKWITVNESERKWMKGYKIE